MKFLKFGLRLWITVVSLLSFLGGWIMLGHAPKPSQSGSSPEAIASPLPTLEPLPALIQNDGNSVQSQPFFSNQPRNTFRQSPFFSTGGS